ITHHIHLGDDNTPTCTSCLVFTGIASGRLDRCADFCIAGRRRCTGILTNNNGCTASRVCQGHRPYICCCK
ncbi:unnamed protein product, partial [Rotaria sp. Silwood1]